MWLLECMRCCSYCNYSRTDILRQCCILPIQLYFREYSCFSKLHCYVKVGSEGPKAPACLCLSLCLTSRPRRLSTGTFLTPRCGARAGAVCSAGTGAVWSCAPRRTSTICADQTLISQRKYNILIRKGVVRGCACAVWKIMC